MKAWTVVCAILFFLSVTASCARAEGGLLRVGDRPPALDFKCYDSEKTFDWAGLKGRVVVIEFWATWCPPCIKNIPHINGLVNEFRNDPVTFISITYETGEMVKKFLVGHPLKTVVGLDNDFAMFKSYRAWGIPMTVIVNRKGKIACVIHPDNLNDSVIHDVINGKLPHVKSAQPWPDPRGAEQYFRSLLKKAQSEK